jgi:hypothetical protein
VQAWESAKREVLRKFLFVERLGWAVETRPHYTVAARVSRRRLPRAPCSIGGKETYRTWQCTRVASMSRHHFDEGGRGKWPQHAPVYLVERGANAKQAAKRSTAIRASAGDDGSTGGGVEF